MQRFTLEGLQLLKATNNKIKTNDKMKVGKYYTILCQQ